MTAPFLLHREGATEAISVEHLDGQDGEGAPSYTSPVDHVARVVLESGMVRQADGEFLPVHATLWVPTSGDTATDLAVMPRVGSRVVVTASGWSGIVVERKEGRSLQDRSLGMVRCRLREE